MFSLLVVDQNLQIVKIAFAIVTPWPRQNLLNIGMSPLFLRHVIAHCRIVMWCSYKRKKTNELAQRHVEVVVRWERDQTKLPVEAVVEGMRTFEWSLCQAFALLIITTGGISVHLR